MKERTQFQSLKQQYQKSRNTYNLNFEHRLYKIFSWIEKTEKSKAPSEEKFILFWIIFNILYACDDDAKNYGSDQRLSFADFFLRIEKCDTENEVYKIIWKKFSGSISSFMKNVNVFNPYVRNTYDEDSHKNWEEMFKKSNQEFQHSFRYENTVRLLNIIFERMYVLRNQIFHGYIAASDPDHKDEIRDATAILENLLPVFLKIVMENPKYDWNEPYKEIETTSG